MNSLATLLVELEGDPGLDAPGRIRCRIEALDRIDSLLAMSESIDASLRRRADRMRERLESRNEALYEDIRADIRAGRGMDRVLRWVSVASSVGEEDDEGYDHLDELVSGLLQFGEPGAPAIELAQEMVFYQPTPARRVFEMMTTSGLGPGDVLVDLGSGLGHVPLLTAICTRARAIGIELEPAYVACARQVAIALNLGTVAFIEQDAREADLASGTVFYLYTPFKGAMLREVLDRLRREAEQRDIRVCTFGPCTPVVAREPWLIASASPVTDRVVLFRSAI